MAGLTAYLTVVKLDNSTQIDIALMRQRIEVDESDLKLLRSDHKQLVDQVSISLDKIKGQVSDLRVDIAAALKLDLHNGKK